MNNTTEARLDDLCRTERYFTSALLTGLFFEDNLRGMDEFFRWLIANKGLAVARVDDGKLVTPASINTGGHVEILTEFNIKRELRCYHPDQLTELITDINDCDNTLDVTDGQSVPDVVLLADDTLLVMEGKFFVADQSPAKINMQLRSQKEEIELMVRHLAPRVKKTCHVYLSPEVDLDPDVYDCDLVLSWEDIYAFACELVGEGHYISQRLATANARYRASQAGSRGGRRTKNYRGTCAFDELLEMCRENGQNVLIGFSGGKSQLRASSPSYLRNRTYKWDDANNTRGKKSRSNWIRGDEFLRIVGRHADSF